MTKVQDVLSDLRNASYVSEEDLQWFIDTVREMSSTFGGVKEYSLFIKDINHQANEAQYRLDFIKHWKNSKVGYL